MNGGVRFCGCRFKHVLGSSDHVEDSGMRRCIRMNACAALGRLAGRSLKHLQVIDDHGVVNGGDRRDKVRGFVSAGYGM